MEYLIRAKEFFAQPALGRRVRNYLKFCEANGGRITEFERVPLEFYANGGRL